MRLEAEVRPDGTVLRTWRRPPISRLPPLDRHGSLLRAPPAPLGLTSAGRGPGGGTRMALMDPSSITFLAIVVVAGGRRRDGLLLGRGFRETLPQHVPVPWEAAEPQTPEADRPATPEWIVHEESPRLVQGGSALLDHHHRIRPCQHRAGSSGRAPSWTLRLALRLPLVERLRGERGLSCSFPNIQHDVVPPVFSGCALESFESLARLRECRIMVPSVPIRAGPPRANNHSLVFLVGGPEELSSYPTWSHPRGR